MSTDRLIRDYLNNGGVVTYIVPSFGRRWQLVLACQRPGQWEELWADISVSAKIYTPPEPPLHLLAFHAAPPPPLDWLYRAHQGRKYADVYSTSPHTLKILCRMGLRGQHEWKIERFN